MYLLWQAIFTESSIRNFLLTIVILSKAKDLKPKIMKLNMKIFDIFSPKGDIKRFSS